MFYELYINYFEKIVSVSSLNSSSDIFPHTTISPNIAKKSILSTHPTSSW